MPSATIAKKSIGPSLMPLSIEDLRIDPAAPHDLDRFLDLLEEAAQFLADRGIVQWPPGQFHASSAYYRESLGRGEAHLAFLGDELVGVLRLLPHDSIVWPEAGPNEAFYLYNLAVRHRWAGHGLGARLLMWAEGRTAAMERPYLRLDCFAHNERLRQYYLAAGFQNCGDVDARYPEPIGTLRLTRLEKAVQANDRRRR